MYLHICPHAHADNEYGGVRHRQLYTPASTGQPRRFEEESELVNKWLGYHRVMKKICRRRVSKPRPYRHIWAMKLSVLAWVGLFITNGT